jgi:hypothetical protein
MAFLHALWLDKGEVVEIGSAQAVVAHYIEKYH